MKRFIEGEDRVQATLFPEQLDDYIAEENSVRVIDVFVDELDLSKMGFKTVPAETGRPSYHSATMLKLYIYGYLNRIQSSRRLERESQRNVELMWLLGRLAPDFKTIADFRKNNTRAICLVCREFVLLCRKLDLFSEAFVAIDGSKFKAVNNRDLNFTRAKLKYRLSLIDESIAKYLKQIDSADRQDTPVSKIKVERLENKIANLKEEIKRLNEIEVVLEATPDKQISLTDPDARSMKARGTGIVGYNVQAAVDTRHHIIVAHEVTNIGNDRAQLFNMAKQAKMIIGRGELKVVADRGYYNGEEILACEQSGITSFLPKPQTSGNQAKGLFGKRDFIYKSELDAYECPGGQQAIYRFSSEDKGKVIRRYWSSACLNCSLKPKCTTGKYRRISRWEHESVLEAVDERLEQDVDMMKIRKSTVEHPFGTIKFWMGATHFQMKTLKKVRVEMSLHVLSYNLKRMMKIMGTVPLMEAMRA
ncbi:MAG: IS1182 family transposase [Alphaproteobacteria bacterium]|nr:IS1182 family transposase [Alphaproteobacteria bacterium]